MKFKKILILVVLLSVWSSTMIFANSASQKIKVSINGSNLGEVGIFVDNTTYLPLRRLGESLKAIVDWDSSKKSAMIFQPNVHMFVYNVGKDGSEKTFGEVNKGFSGKIRVFAQIDNVNFNLKSTKITITDPAGKETELLKVSVDKQREDYWVSSEEFTYKFSSSGTYTIKLYMLTDMSEDWIVTSEKGITSK